MEGAFAGLWQWTARRETGTVCWSRRWVVKYILHGCLWWWCLCGGGGGGGGARRAATEAAGVGADPLPGDTAARCSVALY